MNDSKELLTDGARLFIVYIKEADVTISMRVFTNYYEAVNAFFDSLIELFGKSDWVNVHRESYLRAAPHACKIDDFPGIDLYTVSSLKISSDFTPNLEKSND